jgi:trimeric autotransporter adhesin
MERKASLPPPHQKANEIGRSALWLAAVALFTSLQSSAQQIPLPFQGIINTIVNTAGTSGTAGVPGPAAEADLGSSTGVAVDAQGNLYIADYNNGRILAVNMGSEQVEIAGVSIAAGYAAVVAGVPTDETPNCNTLPSSSGPAIGQTLCNPMSVALDANGNIYVADYTYNLIRVVNVTATSETLNGITVSAGDIATIAGGNNSGNYCPAHMDNYGDNCSATGTLGARLVGPYGVAVDSNLNVYIGDSNSGLVRKVTGGASGGLISAVAGTTLSGGQLLHGDAEIWGWRARNQRLPRRPKRGGRG